MELVERWLKISNDDLRCARVLFETDKSLNTAIVYHARQSAEKALKAFLTFRNEKIKKTHDLELLVSFCENIDDSFNKLHPGN